jgi:hypothetical protein
MSRKRKLDSYHCREGGEVNQNVIDDALALWVSTINEPAFLIKQDNNNNHIEDWLESIGHRLPPIVIGWMQKSVKNVPQFVRLWRISCSRARTTESQMESSASASIIGSTNENIVDKFLKQFQPSDISELIMCISQDQRLQKSPWGVSNGIWWRLSLRTFPFFGTTQIPDSSARAWFQFHLNRLGLLGRKRKMNKIHVLEALARAPTSQQLIQDLTDLSSSSASFCFSDSSVLKFLITCSRCFNIFPVREKWMPDSHTKTLPFNEFLTTLLQFLWTNDHMIARGPDDAHSSLETISDIISMHLNFGPAKELAIGHDQSYIFGKLSCTENDLIQPTDSDLQMVQLILAFAVRSQHPSSWAGALFPNWYVYYHIFRESQWWFPALQILLSPDSKFPPCPCRHHRLNTHAYSSHTYPCSSDQEFSMSSRPFFRPVDDPATAIGHMKRSVLYLQQTQPKRKEQDLLQTGLTIAFTHLILLLNVYGLERSKAILALTLTGLIGPHSKTNTSRDRDSLWKNVLRVAEPMIQQWFTSSSFEMMMMRERREKDVKQELLHNCDREKSNNNLAWFLHQSPKGAKFCYWLQDRHNDDGCLELKMIYLLISNALFPNEVHTDAQTQSQAQSQAQEEEIVVLEHRSKGKHSPVQWESISDSD